MTKEEAVVHEREVVWGNKTPEEVYDKETVAQVQARMQEEIGFEKYR
jgi:glucose-6-phosphate 1-dehydrogenase